MDVSWPIPQLVESFRNEKADCCSVSGLAGGDCSHNRDRYRAVQTNRQDIMGGHNESELFTDNYCRVCCAMLISEVQRTTHYESKKHANKVRLYFQIHKEEDGAPYKKLKTDVVGFQDAGTGEVDKNKLCTLCNMVFTSAIVAQSHYQGKVHAKRLKQLAGEQPSVTQAQTASTDVASVQSEGNSIAQGSQPDSSKQDLVSEAPAVASMALDLEDPNKFCKLCSASFNNPLMAQQHYNGKKHKKNDARRQLLEDMGKEADPVETNVGTGDYPCAICNITLNSIEQYQSHQQGYKHQLKENKVADLVLNTKSKKYDSFQDELDDFIKVQRARGLAPKTYFRKSEERSEEEIEDLPIVRPPPSPPAPVPIPTPGLEYIAQSRETTPGLNPCTFPEECDFQMQVHDHTPKWASLEIDSTKTTYMQTNDLQMEYYTERQPPMMASYPEDSRGPSSVESADDHRPMTSDDSSSSSKKDKRRRKRKHGRERRDPEETESERDEECQVYRKESNQEEVERVQSEDQQKHKAEKRDKEELESGKEEKLKHGKKERKVKEDPCIEKEDAKPKHKKEKKKREEVDTRTEEEKLWDESILGI
ncbi:zinc finger matrin-type protein 1-like isoform X1 [Callorhinchus milii]|uniref:zinc finger matrin-type protein 1-like isoform X1 n=2 Tax=Callorhinchus milii TaxID=7868 RepID=UPI001C3FF646|nr:zinc finger matrin-type protein 1-like isoform X1 [Callorhinchus milii]